MRMGALRQNYRDALVEIMDHVLSGEPEVLDAARDVLAAALGTGRLIYVGGSGHSHMLAEELFYRAGGIAAVQPILEPDLMLHEGARRSTEVEREAGRAERSLSRFAIEPGDVLIVVSNSGRNAYPVELAEAGRKRGMTVIALTSLRHAARVESRHSSGLLLRDVADIVLDNGGVYGDAILPVGPDGVHMGPTSTIIGCFILNALVAEAVEMVTAQGKSVDIYASANIEDNGSPADNVAERWGDRIAGL